MPLYKVGLDFGTSNSVLSYLEDEKLQVFEIGSIGDKATAPDSFSFSPLQSNIESLVVSIPETWFRNIDNQGRINLEHLIVNKLGIEDKFFQLVSDPVAAEVRSSREPISLRSGEQHLRCKSMSHMSRGQD